MHNGLVITDLGFRGLIVETAEPAFSDARARHAAFQALVERFSDQTSGVQLVLTALSEGVALHRATLDSLTAIGSARLYKSGEGFEVELPMGNGWLDRRLLPEPVVKAIRANRGCVVNRKDLTAAEAAIRQLPAYADAKSPLDCAIADALAWWYPLLPGPLFAHVTRRRPFQVLDRAARARVFSKRPQRSAASSAKPAVAAVRQAYEKCFTQKEDMTVIAKLVTDFGRVARQNGSKPGGREKLMELVQGAIPRALQAGRAQMLIIGGLVSVLLHGGVRGRALAPVTIYEYSRQHLEGLATDLAKAGVDSRSGEQWLSTYKEMLKKVLPSQQGKLTAFLEAFHVFLVLVGMERLPASICGHRASIPPAAAIVTDHELGLALAFVREHAETQVIAAQASIALLLGFEVELRTYELWCIRMVDVQLEHPPYLVVYPRRCDGTGKTPSLRRQDDLFNRVLLRLLVAFKNRRLTVDFASDDEDLFFGEPGAPDQRHAQEKTMRLVNASLAWATGKRVASFYDLRHTAFSRKAQRVLKGD